MPRLSPRAEVLRALFARSGNRCAFPGCNAILVNERNQFVANVCHIEAAEEGGERFNPLQSNEDRRRYENLLLLCYPHHVETNEVDLYSVDRLQTIKAEHEQVFGQKPYKIDESLLHKVAFEMEQYWIQVEALHRLHVAESDLAMDIDANATFFEIADVARSIAKDLTAIQAYLKETDQIHTQAANLPPEQAAIEVKTRLSARAASGPNDFEMLYVGFTNTITLLNISLAQMELKYAEEHLKLNPADSAARQRLEQRKVEFARFARHAGHVD